MKEQKRKAQSDYQKLLTEAAPKKASRLKKKKPTEVRKNLSKKRETNEGHCGDIQIAGGIFYFDYYY